MKFASPKHTRQEIITLTAQFGVTFGSAFVEKACLVILKYRKAWREHATYRAAIDAGYGDEVANAVVAAMNGGLPLHQR